MHTSTHTTQKYGLANGDFKYLYYLGAGNLFGTTQIWWWFIGRKDLKFGLLVLLP